MNEKRTAVGLGQDLASELGERGRRGAKRIGKQRGDIRKLQRLERDLRRGDVLFAQRRELLLQRIGASSAGCSRYEPTTSR